MITLARFPLRSFLASLSAALGVAAAVTSVNYALGGREKLTRQFERMGTNILIVTPRQSRTVAGRARTGSIVKTLVPADAAGIVKQIPLIVRASPSLSGVFLVKAGGLARNNTPVIGVEPAYFAIKHWEISRGQLFTTADSRRAARLALLGAALARDLFGPEDPTGLRISINRVPFEISGVLSERGQGLDAANEDAQIYVPLATAMHRLANADYYSGLTLEIGSSVEMDSTAAMVSASLRQRHRRIGKLPEDFDVQNRQQLMDTQLAVSARLYVYARSIGAAALLVAGLGALAISWISVRERTREIGTRRALGAARLDIFLQFFFESIVPAAAGCAAGLAVAWKSSASLANAVHQPAIFDPGIARVAIVLALGVHVLFALLPAQAAARLDPIRALQFE